MSPVFEPQTDDDAPRSLFIERRCSNVRCKGPVGKLWLVMIGDRRTAKTGEGCMIQVLLCELCARGVRLPEGITELEFIGAPLVEIDNR